MAESAGPRKRRKLSVSQAAPGGESDIHITCVEYWNNNLYIGTSAAEILHLVSLPPQPSDESNEPNFILASRLPITGNQDRTDGIQRIVLLPAVGKACVLCNGVVTFYSLPELSPAFENTKVRNCQWIGGRDLNQNVGEDSTDSPVIMIAAQNRIMVVQIGDTAHGIRSIKFPGCLVGSRRDTIACVADENSYSLLEVEHQQKIPLFPISSSSDVFELGHMEDIPPSPSTLKRSSSASYSNPEPGKSNTHGRSTSLNTFVEGLGGRRESPHSRVDRSSNLTPDLLGGASPRRSISGDRRDLDTSKDLPATPGQEPETDTQKPLPPAPKLNLARLKPHIASPTPSEFLLVTGTAETEPGVGMFVNTDGDVVRGTMEFQRYPETVIVDSPGDLSEEGASSGSTEGFVLAVLKVDEDESAQRCLEIQRWDVNPGEEGRQKSLLEIPNPSKTKALYVGLGHTTGSSDLNFFELGDSLRMVKLQTPKAGGTYTPSEETDPRTNATIEQLRKEKELFEYQESSDSETGKKLGSSQTWELERTKEGAAFARGLGKARTSLIVWSGDQIWRVLRNPLALQLDSLLESTQTWKDRRLVSVDRDAIVDLLDSIKTIEPKTEAEFLGLGYVRQKAGLLLFADLLSMSPKDKTNVTIHATEEALVESDLDPRLILYLVPFLSEEILLSREGIWVHHGLAQVAEFYLDPLLKSKEVTILSDDPVLNLLKRYLFAWQRRRGYGSVTNDTNVFDSVDAALLHLILEQETQARRHSQPVTSIHNELNGLVDHWKANFDRAISLLERYQRLFVLSRLYQSKKMLGKVLKTWRRIAEGEKDDDPSVTITGVEEHVRKYLGKIRDMQLVEEYGSWLASRNSKLGIRVFSDDSSRLKLDPNEVVKLLKTRAPNAVQDYLEHLVFSKNYSQYVDDLIAYYLDTILNVLQSSPDARASLKESYSTYRALRLPKPTYLHFISENAPPEAWWQSRLRLLQLLGGPNTVFTSTAGRDLSYSISAVLSRIEPFQDELVSESIILDGRQGRHKEALRLLTHGLGDYDSAIRYCLLGGTSGTQSAAFALSSTTENIKGSEQADMFKYLLTEFLHIENVSDRIERTSDLLARFSHWFEVHEVLSLIPDDWSVDILSDFLAHVFRDLVSQGREVRVQKALSASLSLRIGVEYLEDLEKRGGWVEDDQGLRSLKPVSENFRVEANQTDDGDDFGDMVSAGRT
ncbi:putative TGF beta receptor associated protein 1 [Talaromyces proteolyticus]|uniref:TGF beta receptor associated protein 1 n=1 Tax=Talaromyces proteolyticus TaxID=1131652 RepID=A0AAD4Q1Z0_9EURO|nr:putative TGF beta receptor associated protein 1 [Talaromyces proteolyticus]KAH8699015.1 putative TGF beta receptor associated protein 1 [Talaromyces proteolyticus]